MIEVFSSILTNALFPVLAIVGFGYGLQRWRPMESATLVTLNLYLFVPVYLFVRVLDSTLLWGDIVRVGVGLLLPVLVVGLLAWAALSRRKIPGETVAALLVGGLFSNCGNFGLPVAEIAFGARGGEVHAIVVLFANFSIFSIAYMMLAMGKGEGASAVLNYFKLPYFYCVVVALFLRDTGLRDYIPTWLHSCSHTIANGLVPIALVTLGSQLARRARWPNWAILTTSLCIKLLILPIATFAGVRMLGMWPWPGVVIVLAAAAPTAINPLLLAMQLDGDTETLSDCVFWTTLFSAVSVAVWMTILKMLAGDSFL